MAGPCSVNFGEDCEDEAHDRLFVREDLDGSSLDCAVAGGDHGRLNVGRSAGRRCPDAYGLAYVYAQIDAPYEGINLFECVARNTLHINTDPEFCPEPDYAHDIKLMKHHLRCLQRTIRDFSRTD